MGGNQEGTSEGEYPPASYLIREYRGDAAPPQKRMHDTDPTPERSRLQGVGCHGPYEDNDRLRELQCT